jgi:hypothetical protein
MGKQLFSGAGRIGGVVALSVKYQGEHPVRACFLPTVEHANMCLVVRPKANGVHCVTHQDK